MAKRYRHQNVWCRIATIWILLLSSASALAGQTEPLQLSTLPLFAASGVPPNVLVAVDDSGSMDWEMLFPTDSGLPKWNSATESFMDNGEYSTTGSFYGYLFPNGDNNCGNISCADEMLYGSAKYHAAPPIPSLGFMRSAQYNKAYFDPAADYKPWVGRDESGQPLYTDSDPTHAYFDPVIRQNALDLTQIFENNDSGHSFYLPRGMKVAPGVIYAHGGGWSAEPVETECAPNYSYCNRGFGYFPATFYLKATPGAGDTRLPSDFGWSPTAPVIHGSGPSGEPLLGYEIRPGNFVSAAAYKSAIQNFANWFTYYRKRHLAARAGLTAAFDQVQTMRVGDCTINNRPSRLTMRDISDDTQRLAFYRSIYDINFRHEYNTPNRSALSYLGGRLRRQDDIVQSPCQRNFAILFTDGYNNRSTSGYANADGDSQAARTYGMPFADSYTNTIADVAMTYYENLGPVANSSIETDKVPVPSQCKVTPPARPDPALDCETHQHMVTLGVTLGQQGYLFSNPDYPALNADPYHNWPEGLEWPTPNGPEGREQIDDLWHATINSRGKLFNATTPEKLADAFSAALESVINASGSGSGIASDGSTLTSNPTIYQASFTGGSWSGDLVAYAVNAGANDKTKKWRASVTLANTAPSERTILTAVPQDNGYDNNRAKPTAFEPATLTMLGVTSPTAQEISYIRGDRSQELSRGGTLRDRSTTVLGDIVHSTPLYIGAPDRLRYPRAGQWQDKRHPLLAPPENKVESYADPVKRSGFAFREAARTPMVYVGANDGMLHGFNADTGAERLGYVPGDVLPRLSALTKPSYTHQYYVDGSPVEGDVVFDGDWHTVLVSGLRNGGRSIFALDVTDPENFSENDPDKTVLWEYTDKDDLGQTFGQPSIIRLHSGQWAALVSNGYNSAKGDASLYLLNIEDGSLIARIKAGYSTQSDGSPNGLSSPFPVDLDGDFITDYIYAGDLQGHIWKFDVTATNPSQWTSTLLFTATDNQGQPQPITTQVQVGVHPYGRKYGVMVYAATGKYLEAGDAQLDTGLKNSVYGIWDPDVFTFNEANDGKPLFSFPNTTQMNRWNLIGQSAQDIDVNGAPYRLVSDNPVGYQTDANGPHVMGWYLDLPAGDGEMVVSDPRIQGDTLIFSTSAPDRQECTPGGGKGYFMALRLDNGGRTDFPAFDLNGDLLFNDRDRVASSLDSDSTDERVGVSGVGIEQGLPGKPHVMLDRDNELRRVSIPTSDGEIVELNVNDGDQADRRRSWREIRR